MDPDVVINMGVLQANLGDSAAALATLTRAAAIVPHDVDVLYNLGLMQWRLGHQAEARKTWARLFAEAPASDLAKAVHGLLEGRSR